MSDADRVLAGWTESSYGVFTAAQARAAGFTVRERGIRLAAGRWVAIHQGVYRLAGAPLSWRGSLLAACWASGDRAAASHRSAAELWGLPGGRDRVLEIVCPRWRRARHPGLIVHETKVLPGPDVMELDRLPVTTPELTVLTLGAVCGPRTVELAFENTLRRELATIGSYRNLLHRIGRQGRNGAGVLRAILDERDPANAPTGSDMETRLLQVLRSNGLPTPVPQFVINDARGNFVGRVDFAIVEWKVALEYESIEWHTGKAALLRDTARRRRIMGLGWKPIGVTVADLRDGGFKLCAEIRDAARRAS